MKEFAEADFFLYLRSLAFLTDQSHHLSEWTPYSMASLRMAPEFLIRAQSKKYCENLMVGLGTKTVLKLRNVVDVARQRGSVDGSPWSRNPLAEFSSGSLASK